MSWSLVQSTTGGNVSGSASSNQIFTTSSAGFASPTTAGNLLVLVIWADLQCAGNPAFTPILTPSTPGFSWQTANAESWGGSGTSLPHATGIAKIYYIANAASMGTGVLTTVSSNSNQGFVSP